MVLTAIAGYLVYAHHSHTNVSDTFASVTVQVVLTVGGQDCECEELYGEIGVSLTPDWHDRPPLIRGTVERRPSRVWQ